MKTERQRQSDEDIKFGTERGRQRVGDRSLKKVRVKRMKMGSQRRHVHRKGK